MMLEFSEYLKVFITLAAIINPFGAIPFAMSVTRGYDRQEVRKINRIVVISVISVLSVALFLGEAALEFFNISLSSFRVAGGILVLSMALSMMHGKTSPVKQTSESPDEFESKEAVAVVPLTMPLLTGPGAMGTVIVFAYRGSSWEHYAAIFGVICLLGTIVGIVFHFIPLIARNISKTGLNVMTRIFGLILASIAIEFIAIGLRELFPALQG